VFVHMNINLAKQITRSDLYQQVWETPIHQLSKKYGLSDVGLAKICKRHNIPRPPRGYWARLAAGQSPSKTPLPKPDQDERITIHPSSVSRLDEVSNPDIQSKIDAVQNSKGIAVPKALRNPHPLIARSLEILEYSSPNDLGVLDVSSVECLDIKVSPSSLKRALRIMQALIQELVVSGSSFEGSERGINIVIEGERLQIGISEIIESEKVQPEENQLKGSYHFGHSRFEYKRRASSRLCLTIHDTTHLWDVNLRNNWRDTSKKSLEDQLDSFLVALFQRAGLYREKRLREAEKERQRQERKKQEQLEADRLEQLKADIKKERRRVKQLIADSSNYFLSKQVREFIAAVETAWNDGDTTYSVEGDLARWLQWAKEQADRLDPLSASPPSILDQNPEQQDE